MNENILLQRMKSILDEMWAKCPNCTHNWDGDYNELRKTEDVLEKQVLAIDKEVGEGIKIGRVMRVPHGDGYAEYWVYKVTKSSVKVAWLAFGDGWDNPIVPKSGSVPMRIAKLYIRDRGKRMFGSSN